jgi:hypothetical protein
VIRRLPQLSTLVQLTQLPPAPSLWRRGPAAHRRGGRHRPGPGRTPYRPVAPGGARVEAGELATIEIEMPAEMPAVQLAGAAGPTMLLPMLRPAVAVPVASRRPRPHG